MSTNTNTSTPDSWDFRIEQAATVLSITPDQVEEILSEYGVKKEHPLALEMLSDENTTPFGDLRKEFCERGEGNVAVPLLRMAMKFLRGPKDSATTETVDVDLLELKTKYGVETKLEDLSIEQLLPFYKANKKNAIHTILVERYGNKAIIAFKPDTSIVAMEETINYVCDLEAGYSEDDSVEVDGELVRLYPVGQLPNQLVDEDPLYVGQPLKRDRSMNNRVNWKEIRKSERQFFRVLMSRGDISPNDRVAIMQLIEKGQTELKAIFPEAYMEFKELDARGDLPKLTMSVNEATTKRIQNPFEISTGNRRW